MQTLGLSEMRLLVRSCVVESQPRVKAAVAMSLKIAPIIYFFIYPFFLLDTSSFPLLQTSYFVSTVKPNLYRPLPYPPPSACRTRHPHGMGPDGGVEGRGIG